MAQYAPRFLCVFFLACLLVPLATAQAEEDTQENGGRITMQSLASQDLRQFALQFYQKEKPDKSWQSIIEHDAEYAMVDLNDDGSPDLILLIDNPEWCGTAGCRADYFITTPQGYQHVCTASSPESGPLLLPQKEFGIHLIRTWEETLHWKKSHLGAIECEGKDMPRLVF